MISVERRDGGSCGDELDLGLVGLEAGDSGGAVVLDSESVSAGGHPEEATLSPVGSPGVSADPVVLAGLGILAVSDDGDLVVDHGEELELGVDAAGVLLEVVGDLDSAGDGAVLEDLGSHLLGASEAVVVAHVVVLVVNGPALVLAGLVDGAGRPGAVLAEVDGIAGATLEVVGDVLLAGGVGDSLLEGELVDASGVSSLAGASGSAVDDGLGVEADGGGVQVSEHDVESVGEGGGGALGPAGAAVDGDVLVLVPGEEVGSVDVSPVNVLGDLLGGELLPGVDLEGLLAVLEEGLLDSAAGLGEEEVLLELDVAVGSLVPGVVLLLVGGDVLLVLGPGVLGGGPGAVGLNGDVVDSSDHSDEAVLAEVGAPGVPDGPVLDAVLDSEADHGDVVDDVEVAGGVLEDAAGVVLEGLGHCDSAGNGASLVDLLHHGLLALDGSVLLDAVHEVLVGHEAGLVGHAVLAHGHGGALLAVVVATGSVDGAGLVGDLVLVHPLEGVVCLSSVAAVVATAGDEDLGGDVDVRPGSIPLDLDPVRESRGGGVGPAGTAVLGDVLVPDVGQVAGGVHVVPDPLLGQLNSRERLFDVSGLGLS
mmetsp:Transcript_12625/g.21241  ORF Transcript_12625/g.21241 Transcript_12625/m.21241 type:complete len:592 (+) Transcript_12625:45-1820(+)